MYHERNTRRVLVIDRVHTKYKIKNTLLQTYTLAHTGQNCASPRVIHTRKSKRDGSVWWLIDIMSHPDIAELWVVKGLEVAAETGSLRRELPARSRRTAAACCTQAEVVWYHLCQKAKYRNATHHLPYITSHLHRRPHPRPLRRAACRERAQGGPRPPRRLPCAAPPRPTHTPSSGLGSGSGFRVRLRVRARIRVRVRVRVRVSARVRVRVRVRV